MNIDNKILEDAIYKFGNLNQWVKAIEELSELIKEISKLIQDDYVEVKIVEEIADVYIMLEQLKIMLNLTDETLQKQIDFKLNRLKGIIKNAT
jgi:hypothetical protein